MGQSASLWHSPHFSAFLDEVPRNFTTGGLGPLSLCSQLFRCCSFSVALRGLSYLFSPLQILCWIERTGRTGRRTIFLPTNWHENSETLRTSTKREWRPFYGFAQIKEDFFLCIGPTIYFSDSGVVQEQMTSGEGTQWRQVGCSQRQHVSQQFPRPWLSRAQRVPDRLAVFPRALAC